MIELCQVNWCKYETDNIDIKSKEYKKTPEFYISVKSYTMYYFFIYILSFLKSNN